MKMRVKAVFCDKFTGEMYAVGQMVDIDDSERAEDLQQRKLAELAEKPKAKRRKKAPA